jgi:HSP20 family protein
MISPVLPTARLQARASCPPWMSMKIRKKLVLKLEIPGVKPEDLDIKLENQTLVIQGERKFESSEKAENFHRIERRFGSFVRSFTLPQTVDTENVAADADAGVLTVTLTKKAEAQPKQIKVQVAKDTKQVEAGTQ